ncbi:MAG: tRNA (guanosine(37)-N1)-methyltransferase TrmD [Bdellovibrionales bacterium]|nr:tRNA (guanosine(37)-N1)-methyltransferase TrmD [Bdellovibrionales bacterium]
MQFQVLTLFPESFQSFFGFSLIGKAIQKGLAQIQLINPRDFATDKHRTVDDAPYGGGEGMLMKADVLKRAWDQAKAADPQAKTIMLSPQGKLLTQAMLWDWSKGSGLILVCGHYEGVDERFIEACVDEEISIGDYVLTGGEWPAQVLMDGVIRLLPGVVGNADSIQNDSLEGGLLKYPQYTRPPEFEGRKVPDILTSGDHGKVAKWRHEESLKRTKERRPDLWEKGTRKP